MNYCGGWAEKAKKKSSGNLGFLMACFCEEQNLTGAAPSESLIAVTCAVLFPAHPPNPAPLRGRRVATPVRVWSQ